MHYLPQSCLFSFHSPAVKPESSCSPTHPQSASSFCVSLRKKGTFRNGEISFGVFKKGQACHTHVQWPAFLHAWVRGSSVTPPWRADPTHCEPCVRSLYLLLVFQAHIRPKRPECKHYTDNAQAYVSKLTFNRNWLHKRLYLNSSQTKLLIWKRKLYFQSNGMSEQDSLGDKFACIRLRQNL